MGLNGLERWRRLPRDARDTLFLLGVIAWTILPHAAHVPAWCVAFAGALLAWRARLALINAPLPRRRWLLLALVVAIVLTLRSHGAVISSRDAGITMAVVLMALKTLELRARRDAFVVFFLGFFVVLMNFLYGQSIFAATAMLVSVWGLMTSLVLAHMPAGRPSIALAGAQAARAALFGAPLMVLLFLLFPRIGPLWGVPQESVGKTGLSGTLQLGAMAEIADDDSVALRVRFLGGAAPPAQEMYFRGPVLSRFDGREWRATPAGGLGATAARASADLRVSGASVRYEMTLEPSRLAMLPLLEATPAAPTLDVEADSMRPTMRDDLTWLVQRPLLERTRLIATAYPRFRHGPVRPDLNLRDDLELPPLHNPRTLQWADDLRNRPDLRGADATTLANRVLQHIRSGEFNYTLSPGTYGDTDPRAIVDEFWLDRKAGFCEHFAAAFVVVMRAFDIPARIVTGYQGADPLVIDGYHVVRQSHAHAWAEYWQGGIGWVRADPTAAVAPDRIQSSRYLLPRRGLVAGAINTLNPNLLGQLRSGWEAVNNRWNQWVLNYSRGTQFDILKKAGLKSPSWEDLALLLIACLSTLAFAGAAWAWWDRRRQDPWTRLNVRVRSALAGSGLAAPAHASLRELAARVRERDGGAQLAAWLIALDGARFGRGAMKRPPAGWRIELARHLHALRTR